VRAAHGERTRAARKRMRLARKRRLRHERAVCTQSQRARRYVHTPHAAAAQGRRRVEKLLRTALPRHLFSPSRRARHVAPPSSHCALHAAWTRAQT
jgi:hypothetical protein